MTYETVTIYSQIIALILFLVLFAGAVLHAFWPGNREKFREAANQPLRKDDEIESNGGGA